MSPVLRLAARLATLLHCGQHRSTAGPPVRAYADCGRPTIGADGTVTSLICPAVWCGRVRVINNRIDTHADHTGTRCRYSHTVVVDDSDTVPTHLRQPAPASTTSPS
ncbi:hypothetical protein [Nocardia donostiensis]|uniref:hypothetical protein n=1 Tax=Nocardia donostiensis TaxID=1538463 RepID=UPI001115682E|nr:hypothetical protein [Nocardia donostiensis]